MHPEEDEYFQHATQNATTMDQFGSDLADSDGHKHPDKRKEQRIKRGECPTCRRKTHKVSRFPFGSKREALTVDGEVVNGHCLICKPVEGYIKRDPRHKPAVPTTLEFSLGDNECPFDNDDFTVASEITMDPFLTTPPVTGANRPSGGSSRYTSSISRPDLMANHFETVSEETPITDFGRHSDEVSGYINDLQRQRRDREQDILGEQDTRVAGGGREHMQHGLQCRRGGERIMEENTTEESEGEDEGWQNHEHLLREMEQNQKFHPLAVHNMSYSENSMSLTEEKETHHGLMEQHEETSHKSSLRDSSLRSSTGVGSAYKQQKFHPLAQMAQFGNSEQSMSLNDDRSHASMQSSDSDKIQRLCQGSRSNLLMEKMVDVHVEKSPTKGSVLPLMRMPSDEGERRSGNGSGSQRSRSESRQKLGGERSDSNRFSLQRISTSSNSINDEKSERAYPSPIIPARKKGERKYSNRFSLTRLDSKGRKLGADKESNRFSLAKAQPRRATTSKISPNLQMEMNASKNWDSMDILRDAAAEANGGDLDAAVDALFGVVDTKKNDGPAAPPLPQKKKSTRRRSSGTHSSGGLSYEDEIIIMATVLSKGATSAHEEEELATTINQRRRSIESQDGGIQLSSVQDIPVIIQAVKSRPDDKKCVERAFQSLFLLATDPDPEEASLARKKILAKGGMEALVSAIWDHMQHTEVILALFHALWAISVFNENDEKSSKASISKIEECGVLDGLLFAMQSHAKDVSIQESGCDLITRLTGLLPNDTPEFKSAVVFLSSNMQNIDTHTKAYSSCLDALNSLCQLSDVNKCEFAKAGNDCHSEIIRGLTSNDPTDLETRELACQLFWCVTSDRTAVSVLSTNGLLSKKIIGALKSVPRANSSVHFFGAACGTLANLALEPDNHSKMIDLGVVPILCEAIYVYDFSEDVNSAACTALANLSVTKEIRKCIVSQGGIPALFSSMKSTSDNPDVQSEALRALHNLCESSSDGKQAIVADLEIIIEAFFRHEGVKYIQQITSSILCRLSAEEKCRKSMTMLPRTFDALAKIMKVRPRKKTVQKAACSALRNLSMEEGIVPMLLKKGFDSLVIDAMDAYSDIEELQENACTFLMNMGSNSPEASVEICSGEGLHSIVKAMQTIPTSVPLQQASCGALYAITKGDAHKNMAVSAGAVDAVICLMLIHSTEIKVLENAVNVLANLSTLKKCTKTIANAGGISTVTEAMRNNPSSTGLILSGSRFIRNMALSGREYANDALGGITPILGCMDEHPDCAKLVEESCKALRCLVLKSESCKDVVIGADGVTVIEKTMEQNSTSQRWQTLLLDELFQ